MNALLSPATAVAMATANSNSTSTVAPGALRSRTGKIARLPQAIRQRLNERLADGEPQHLLVAWLNEHEVVRDRLLRFHQGRLITEQNLSDWKAGGFRDWERHQETRGMLREFLHEAEELSAELGGEELLEKATSTVAVVLLRLFQEALVAEAGPEQRQAVLQIARELSRMRRVSHERQRVQLLVERAHAPSDQPPEPGGISWKEINQRIEKDDEEVKRDDAWIKEEAEALRAEYVAGMAQRALSPERRRHIEEFHAYYQLRVGELGLEPLPAWREPKARVVKAQADGKKARVSPGPSAKTPPTETTIPEACGEPSPAAGPAAAGPE